MTCCEMNVIETYFVVWRTVTTFVIALNNEMTQILASEVETYLRGLVKSNDIVTKLSQSTW